MIDLRGRYLPWVGDGPGSLDEALLMLRMAEADGVRFAVMTPHVDPGGRTVSRTELEKKFAAFAQVVRRRGIHIQLRLGAELIHGPGAIDLIDRRELPFIGEWEGRQVALLRWAEDFVPVGAISTTQDMLARGVLPMLAHPERNPGVVRAPSTLELFLCDGCLVQVDAGSVLGWHGPGVRDTAFALIEAGMATVLASGAADMGTRPPMLRAARDIVAQRFGEETAMRLVEINPSLLVAEDLARGRQAQVARAASAVIDEIRPVVPEAVAHAAAHAPSFHASGVRGDARRVGVGHRAPPGPARLAGPAPGHWRQTRGARDPVIAPADPRVSLRPS